jgi:hypothetical protein
LDLVRLRGVLGENGDLIGLSQEVARLGAGLARCFRQDAWISQPADVMTATEDSSLKI